MACSRYEQHDLQFKKGLGILTSFASIISNSANKILWITVQAVDYVLPFICSRKYILPLFMGSQRNVFFRIVMPLGQASYDTKVTTSYSPLEGFFVCLSRVFFVVTLTIGKSGGPKRTRAFQRVRTYFVSRLERAVCHHVLCSCDRNTRSTIMTRKTMWLSMFPLKWCFKLRYIYHELPF